MMNTSHAMGGLSAGFAVGLLATTPGIGLVCGVVGLVAALLPDLDHPSGRPAKALGPVTWLLCRVLRLASKLVGLPAHRGLTHTVAAGLLIAMATAIAAAAWLPMDVALLFGTATLAGYLSALLGDWLTKASLPFLWWPFHVDTPGPPKWLRIRTGKRFEKYAVLPVLVVASAWTCALVIGVGL